MSNSPFFWGGMVIKIEIRGQRKAIEKAQRVLTPQLNQLEQMNEKDARLKIQDIIDEHRLAAYIMVNGNSVWSKRRILGNVRRIKDAGRLYGEKTPHRELIGGVLYLPAETDPILSKYFYEFLNQHCGSIAHYNIHGWITEYPTLDRLKQFFRKNEYGHRVIDYIPSWMSDAKRIVEAIEMTLFPLESYVRSKKRASFSVGGEFMRKWKVWFTTERGFEIFIEVEAKTYDEARCLAAEKAPKNAEYRYALQI